MDTSAMRQQLV